MCRLLRLLALLLHLLAVKSISDNRSNQIRKRHLDLEIPTPTTNAAPTLSRNLTITVKANPRPGYVVKEINGPVVIETVARFDNCRGGRWQRIFDFGNGAEKDNIWLGQSMSTPDMRFEIIRFGVKYSITARNAIIDGDVATWRVGVDNTGFMWMEKNDVRVAQGKGIVPSKIKRSSKLIGKSNWVWDSALDGAVLGLSVTNDNSAFDFDMLNTVPNIRGAFIIRFFARFDDLRGGNYWQRVFDFGNGPYSDNVFAGQFAGTNDFQFDIYRGEGYDGKRLVARNAIDEGKMTFWRVGVNTNGWMWIEKDGKIIASMQGHVPLDVRRTKNFIGASNWESDSNLQGVVLGLRLDSD